MVQVHRRRTLGGRIVIFSSVLNYHKQKQNNALSTRNIKIMNTDLFPVVVVVFSTISPELAFGTRQIATTTRSFYMKKGSLRIHGSGTATEDHSRKNRYLSKLKQISPLSLFGLAILSCQRFCEVSAGNGPKASNTTGAAMMMMILPGHTRRRRGKWV
jgi:hypothetical protein